MRPLIIWLAFVAGLGVPPGTHLDPFTFFHPDVAITLKDRSALDRGLPVIVMLDAKGHELAVFGAIPVTDAVTADRMIAWLRNVVEYRKASHVLAMRQFSNPARIEDLETLSLDEQDLDDIEDCRVGACGLKLSAVEIGTLQRVIRTSGQDWKAAAQHAFKQLLLRRVARYRHQGHEALEAYRDDRKPRAPVAAFSRVAQHSTFLRDQVPAIAGALLHPPEAPTPGLEEEHLYWSKERLGGKTIISATHVRIFRPVNVKGVEVVMTGAQIFASHYLDASLGITVLMRDRRTAQGYFVYLNRSDVDLLGGLWGGFARRAIEGRIEADAPAMLRLVAERLASGDPPAPSVTRARDLPRK